MNKRFQNNVINKNVADAIRDAEMLLCENSSMLQKIREKDDFEYESGSGEDVYQRLLNHKRLIPVFTYRPWNKWTRSLGVFDGDSIHLNLYKLDSLSHDELVGLLLHEYAHECGFKHGNNWPSEHKNKFSVPYFLSEGRWL